MRVSSNLLFLLFTVIQLSISCNKKPEPGLFELMEDTGIDFANNIRTTPDFNVFNYRNFYNGGGVAIGDINNDGLADIFFTANMGTNQLYLNKGNFQFDDISENAGFIEKKDWSTGVVMVDLNNDGWLDIFVCNAGYIQGVMPQCKLYINNRNLTFTESAKEYGLTNEGGYTTHAAFFDYDLDGDLDCFIINNSFIPVNTLDYANHRELRAKDWPVADFLKGGGDRFLKNENGKFIDVSEEAGIYGSLISFGLGVTVGDVNGDHYPDVYVSNDFFERDYLYINQKNGTFKDELENWMQHTSLASMGADMADINNDGYPDIFTTDMLPGDDYRLKTTSSFDNIDVFRFKLRQGFYYQYMQNTLQVNNRNGKFLETAHYSGVAASDWSWGALIFDADNDGLSDIYVCNGIYNDVTDQDFIDFFSNDIIQKMVLTGKKEEVDQIVNKMPSIPILNKAFKNQGNLKFSDAGESWGFTQPSFSNGAAYGDLDNDGDLDLVINNVNEKAFVYKNRSRETEKNNYIGIVLKGKGNNTFAIGSTIKIYQGTQIITREIIPSRGFQSSVDYKQIIGLGKGQVDSMTIVWPDRTYTKLSHPTVDSTYFIQQGDQRNLFFEEKPYVHEPLLQLQKSNFEKHTEDDFIDFYYERNIPVMLSREGPRAAVGDVNGDGLADVYIGGATKHAGQLYLQTASGFIKKEQEVFKRFTASEDVPVLFFDCDGDADLDLFVGSGGNNRNQGSPELQARLFKNDGQGNFEIQDGAFPQTGDNTSIAIANDFDGDGDLDLFLGGRSIPLNYGITPQSFLFLNDGRGKFTDIAKSKVPAISGIGMVTSAIFSNVIGDDRKELIIAGEWMSPRIFTYKGDRFEEVNSNLKELFGLWQTVTTADLDNDGDQDLLLGNIGENFYLHPDSSHPVKMWINDFDQNSTTDKIITKTLNNKDVPVFMKREVTEQLPSLKKQNLKHHDFAKKTIEDLFPDALLKNSSVRNFDYPSSCIAFNEGNGNFSVVRFPDLVQLSSVNAILCKDLTGDGLVDVVLGGNQFGCLPQFGRLDASLGHVLINKGGRKLSLLASNESGLELRDEIKDVAEIRGPNNKEYLLVLQNNQFPALYQLRK